MVIYEVEWIKIATTFVQYCQPVHLVEALLVIALTSTPVPILHQRIFPVVQVHLAAENTNLANVCMVTLGTPTPELAKRVFLAAHHQVAHHHLQVVQVQAEVLQVQVVEVPAMYG